MVIPRHRPGRRVRATNLQALVQAAGTDPLAGNYTLLPQNDIVAGFLVPSGGGNDTFTVQAFPLSGSSGSDMTMASGATISGMSSSTSGSLPVAMAAGRFTAGTKDSVALVEANIDGIQVILGAFDDQNESFTQLMTGTLLSVDTALEPIVLSAAAGYFTSQATAQLAVVYATPRSGGAVLIFDLSGSSPKQIASQSLFGNNAALCSGDFDGDGYDEVAVARSEQIPWFRQTNLVFDIFKVKDGKYLTPMVSGHVVGYTLEGSQYSIASGAFPAAAGSGVTGDQLAVGWYNYNSGQSQFNVSVFPFATTSGFSVGTCVQWTDTDTFTSGEGSGNGLAAIATADFDLDGYDEIAICYTMSSSLYKLLVLDYASGGTLTMVSGGSQSVGNWLSALSLAAGPINVPGGDSSYVGTNAAVVALQTGEVTIGFVPVSASNQLPPSFTSDGTLTSSVTVGSDVPILALNVNLVVVALGDFSGNSIVVGPPTATTIESVNGLVAVMNMPPFDPNVNSIGTSVLFQSQSQQQTSLSLSVSATWSTSDTLNAKLGIPGIASINTSMTSTYGTGFSNAGLTSTILTTQVSINASADDEILFSVTDYSFWEYPVYQGSASSGADPIGYLMVTWPSNPTLGSWGGLDLNSYYNPSHQVGVIASYPSIQPADIGQELYYSPAETTVGNMVSQFIMTTTLTSQSASKTSNISVSQSDSVGGIFSKFLEGVSLGVSAQFHDSYTENSISTHQVGFADTTTIGVNFGGLMSGDEDDAYTATSILYWSSTDGHLVLDYIVTWGKGSSWSKELEAANPTFTLPWTTQSDEWQYLTRCIAFVPQADGSTDIVATIWNWGTSSVAADTIEAQFYLGDPSNGGEMIGSSIDVPAIDGRGNVQVTQNWTPAADITTTDPAYVYCVLTAATGSTYPNLPMQGLNVYPQDYFSTNSS